MLNNILKEFAVESSCSITPIGNGLINQTWKVACSDKEYILQKVNTDIFKEPTDIDHNLNQLKKYLNENFPDYIFVAPLKAKNGNTLITFEGGVYRLFDFVENSVTINTVEDAKQAFEAAKQFGKFCRLLSGFDANKLNTTIPDFHNLQLRYTQFKTALKNADQNRLKEAKAEIKDVEDHIDILKSYLDILSGQIKLPLRVIHHDSKISNVLFGKNGKGLCVIDLDTVMPGYYLSDVGDMMRSYLSPASEEIVDLDKVTIRLEFFNAVYKGYMSEMEDILTDEEKDLFIYAGKFIIYMQAVRFLTDYLNNDSYYGAKYEKHNLNRAKNQLRLLQEYITASKSIESELLTNKNERYTAKI